jgi:hypothetical protein
MATSDSTRPLATVDGDLTKSFTEAVDTSSSRKTETTCEPDILPHPQTHPTKNGIVISNEINVTVSPRDGVENTVPDGTHPDAGVC